MEIGPVFVDWRYDKKKLKNQVRKTHNWCNQKDNGFLPNLIVQLLPIITPLIQDQLTCSLPKNVITFHGQQDGIIHFCLSPHVRGVLTF